MNLSMHSKKATGAFLTGCVLLLTAMALAEGAGEEGGAVAASADKTGELAAATYEVVKVTWPILPDTILFYDPDFYVQTMPTLVTALASGEAKQEILRFEPWYARYPHDAEVLYGMALAHSAAGDPEKALVYMRQALAEGLPFSRFLAGPRDLFAGLYQRPEFKELAAKEKTLLVHGPVLGAVTDQSARFWLRTAAEADVTITVNASDGSHAAVVAKARTMEQNDLTAVLEVTGLSADTLYTYALTVDGKPAPIAPEPTFSTYRKADQKGVLRIGFGSWSGYSPGHENIWDTIAARRLNGFLLLGDNTGVHGPVTPATQRYGYYRRQSSLPFRHFAAMTPVYAIWDDYDFGRYAVTDGPAAAKSGWPLDVFRQNYANPSNGSTGVWFALPAGDVTFFMLDCFSQRSRGKTGTASSMLGAVQKQWLLDSLKQSTAAFKVIVSAVPWTAASACRAKDNTWDGFAEEREQIFSFIESNKTEGVVLLSGGQLNATDVRRIPRSKGYDLFDLHNSMLTAAQKKFMTAGATLSYDKGCSFGLLEFDTTQAEPRLTFRAIAADGKEVRNHDFVLYRHDLDFEGLRDTDKMAVELAFTKRPLIYGDGSLAEQGQLRVRIENTGDTPQEGVLYLRSIPESIIRFSQMPQYMLDPKQVIERLIPLELTNAVTDDLIRIYAREAHDGLLVGRKMRAARGKSKGDDSLEAIMELVNYRFKQIPGHPLSCRDTGTYMGRIWYAMVDEKLVIHCEALDAAPAHPNGRWAWYLWEGSCLEVFGVNRGQQGRIGESIAQIFLDPGTMPIPGTPINGKPMALRLWQDSQLQAKGKSGDYEGEPLPEIKMRSEMTERGWILEAIIPLKLPVTNTSQMMDKTKKLIQLYPDELRIEFQLNARIKADDPSTSHGHMLKGYMLSQDTEKYAYVEWADIKKWDEKVTTETADK